MTMAGGLDGMRADLLATAARDAERCCCAPERIVQGRRSEQFWLALLAPPSARAVTSLHASTFFDDFQLSRASWDDAAVAGLMAGLRELPSFDPVTGVPRLAEALRAHNRKGHCATSAASKIASFARPEAQVFIWDRLASASARERDRERTGARRAVAGQYKAKDGTHEYHAFHAACASALADERAREDFVTALDGLLRRLRAGTGPLAAPSAVPDAFVERRLLDKLMFWEGRVLLGGSLPGTRMAA